MTEIQQENLLGRNIVKKSVTRKILTLGNLNRRKCCIATNNQVIRLLSEGINDDDRRLSTLNNILNLNISYDFFNK